MTRQDEVRKWAYDHIQARDFLILDTETTGTDSQAEIVQLVIVNAWGKVCFSSLVRPITPIDESGVAFGVHGISGRMVEHAPTVALIVEILRGWLRYSDLTVIAYNSDFDHKMICQAVDTEFGEPAWECAMKKYAAFRGDPGKFPGSYRWHNLKSACEQLGLSLSRNWHDAAADCLATYDLMVALADGYAPIAQPVVEQKPVESAQSASLTLFDVGTPENYKSTLGAIQR